MIDLNKMRHKILELHRLIVARDYISLAALASAETTEEHIRDTFEEYADAYTMPPTDRIEDLMREGMVVVDNTNPQEYAVVTDTYVPGYGRSDLSAELTFWENESGELVFRIDDIDVL